MRTVVLTFLAVIAFPGFSMTQVDVYHSQVAVNETSPDSDNEAQQEALRNVIIKATGNVNAVNNPTIEKAISHVSEYIANIGYGSSDGQRTLKVGFSSNSVRELITQAKLPLWPAKRTSLLVWYVTDDNYQRAILWENGENEKIGQLKKLTEQYGLPVTIPVGDFDDITSVEVSDVWGDFITPISEASERYTPDAVLVVKDSGTDGIRWTLYDQTPQQMLNMSMSPIRGQARGEGELNTLVNELVAYYSQKNSVLISGDSASAVKLNVSNLTSALDFFKLERALKQLSTVASINVQNANNHNVTYQVNLLSSLPEFESELNKIAALSVDEDAKYQSESYSARDTDSRQSMQDNESAIDNSGPVHDMSAMSSDGSTSSEPSVQMTNGGSLYYRWNEASASE